MQMSATVQAMGGVDNLEDVIAYDLQNFALRDTQGRLWSPEEKRLFTAEENERIKKMYNSIYQGNNNPEAADMYQELWEETLEESEAQQESLGYNLASLTNQDGSLNLRNLKATAFKTGAILAPQNITYGDKDCFLFICTAEQWGQLGSTPYVYGGLQATQGGYEQFPSQYGMSGSGFDTIACTTNTNQYDKPLGCGPSAFIGLIGRKFNNGATIDGMNKGTHTRNALERKMLRPSGLNGRPAIASYMGTCYFGGGGLTVGTRFKIGGDEYLLDAQAKSPTGRQLRLQGNVSRLTDNVFANADIKANMLMQEVGRDNNPVVAEYFVGGGVGHYAPVAKYMIRQGASSYVDIKTDDHDDRWWSLSGGWGTERGVFYID